MTFDPIWASDDEALIDPPSDAEIRLGFSCGPASPGLFNWLFQSLMSTINGLGIENMVPSTRRIETAEGITGGGDLTADRTLRLNIPGLETEGSIASDDLIVVYDTSRALHVQMTRENFVSGLGGDDGTISGGANIGTGTGELYASVSGSNLQFRKLLDGGGMVIAVAGNDVSIGLSDRGADLTAE